MNRGRCNHVKKGGKSGLGRGGGKRKRHTYCCTRTKLLGDGGAERGGTAVEGKESEREIKREGKERSFSKIQQRRQKKERAHPSLKRDGQVSPARYTWAPHR